MVATIVSSYPNLYTGWRLSDANGSRGAEQGRERENRVDWTHLAGPVAGIVLVSILGVAPLTTVEAPVQIPSLDWWDEGHTFYYEWDNGTATQQVNITLTEIARADDGTIINGTFQYWGPYNGSNENFTREVHSRLNRSNMNYPGYYTHIWINETNVVDGEAKIGNKSYTLVDDLDTETYKFEGPSGDRTFLFDAAKGWLVKAIYDDKGMEAILLDTMQDTPPEAGPLTTFCGFNDRTSDDYPDQTLDSHKEEHRASTFASATVCFRDTDEFPGSDGNCDVVADGRVQVFKLAWNLFGGHRYTYTLDPNFDAGIAGETLTNPREDIVYMIKDAPPLDGEVDDGSKAWMRSRIYLNLNTVTRLVDDANVQAEITC